MTVARDPALPRRNAWMVEWFTGYCTRYAPKHFHAVRFAKSSHALPPLDGSPRVIVVNHPAWWDIIVCFTLLKLFPDYRFYAPIDAAMLPKYRFFTRLGFFGIDSSPRGAARFIRSCRAIFTEPNAGLFITAQGRFADVRERPVKLMPGVAHAACRLETGYVLPLAVEYPFWDERTPEALLRFGEPLPVSELRGSTPTLVTQRIERALETSMDALAVDALSRDAERFETFLAGKVGIGGPYDLWRRGKAWVRGKRFRPGHGERTA